MTDQEFNYYVLGECRREWDENQKNDRGDWDWQDETTKAIYYNKMYEKIRISQSA